MHGMNSSVKAIPSAGPVWTFLDSERDSSNGFSVRFERAVDRDQTVLHAVAGAAKETWNEAMLVWIIYGLAFAVGLLGPAPLHAGATAAPIDGEQGELWPYHDLLSANAPKAGPEDLRKYAVETGLDMASFEQCVSAGRHAAAVGKDIDEGKRAGVTGTPAFYINGRMLAGAQPLESFVKLIEEELARRR